MLELIPYTDDDPCMRVRISDDALPVGVAFVTVMVDDGLVERPVRDAEMIAVSGAFTRFDFEAPPDVDLTYRVLWFDSLKADAGASAAASTRLVSPRWMDGMLRILIHNPLDPRTAMWVNPAQGFGSQSSRPIPGTVTYGQGRRVGMVQAGRRRGLSGVDFNVVTSTTLDADKFDALFGTAATQRLPILCVRLPEELRRVTRLPAMWFAAVLEPVSFPDVSMGTEQVVWRASADEVASPVPSLVVSLLTLGDIAAYYPTLQAIADDNTTLLALSRRYDLAGSS